MSVSAWEEASNGAPTRVLYGELLDEPLGGLIVNMKIIGMEAKTAPSESRPRKRSSLCLFRLNMLADGSLAATIRFKCLGASVDMALGFYMGYKSPNSAEICSIHVEISSLCANQVQDKTIIVSFPEANSRLVECGVYGLGLINGPKPLALCQILNITIKPRCQAELSWDINSLRVTERGNSSDHHKRLAWRWSGLKDPDLTSPPWSKTTGPFSYFGVMIGGNELGRAYCTEFPIYSEDFAGCKDEKVEVIVRGRLFGGGEITSLPLQLSRDEVGVL